MWAPGLPRPALGPCLPKPPLPGPLSSGSWSTGLEHCRGGWGGGGKPSEHSRCPLLVQEEQDAQGPKPHAVQPAFLHDFPSLKQKCRPDAPRLCVRGSSSPCRTRMPPSSRGPSPLLGVSPDTEEAGTCARGLPTAARRLESIRGRGLDPDTQSVLQRRWPSSLEATSRSQPSGHSWSNQASEIGAAPRSSLGFRESGLPCVDRQLGIWTCARQAWVQIPLCHLPGTSGPGVLGSQVLGSQGGSQASFREAVDALTGLRMAQRPHCHGGWGTQGGLRNGGSASGRSGFAQRSQARPLCCLPAGTRAPERQARCAPCWGFYASDTLPGLCHRAAFGGL